MLTGVAPVGGRPQARRHHPGEDPPPAVGREDRDHADRVSRDDFAPGTVISLAKDRHVPTTRAPSNAPRTRPRSVCGRLNSAAGSIGMVLKNGTWSASTQAVNSSGVMVRISIVIG